MHSPVLFPGLLSDTVAAYLVAPFWSDVDIRRSGDILYGVVKEGDSQEAVDLIMEVSNFVSNQTSDNFTGRWMLVAVWDQVHPYPHGVMPAGSPEVLPLFPSSPFLLRLHVLPLLVVSFPAFPFPLSSSLQCTSSSIPFLISLSFLQ